MISKQDLRLGHYSWASARTDSGLSRKYFDPGNGYQVLEILNSFSASIGALSKNEIHRIEELIHKQLPMDKRSEVSAFNWLRGAYLFFK